MSNNKSEEQKKKEADAKALKEKEKADAKELKEKESKSKFIKGCYYVAPGKTVVSNRKGYLNGGSLVKPEYFNSQDQFDNWVEKGVIVKK